MALFAANCPHCKTEHVSFFSCGFVQVDSTRGNIFFACAHCRSGIIIECISQSVTFDYSKLGGGPLSKHTLRINRIYPEPISISAPDFVPSNVSIAYTQGIDNLMRGNFDAAGMMLRKALDIATKILGGTKPKLVHRIDELTSIGKLTTDMRDWAHEIRTIGNDAAHEEDCLEEKDAQDMENFTELFLTYSFALPGKLAERRSAS